MDNDQSQDLDQVETVDQEKKNPSRRNWPTSATRPEAAKDPSLEELFRRLRVETGNPAEEKVSDVLNAVQRAVLQMDVAESGSAVAEGLERGVCQTCGAHNQQENRFCAKCGVPLLEAVPSAEPAKMPAPGQHHYHHHYHHHYFASGEATAPASEVRGAGSLLPARETGRQRMSAAGPGSRAETAVRKLSHDWAAACNTKHLDDLVELYAADATVVRPNVPPVKSIAAIREYFFAALEAGLGEVEMESLRLEILADVAYDVGRCTMLVPSASGKRREERGKYVIVAVRQAGEWKIAVDTWSTDLSLTAEPGVSKTQGPVTRAPGKSA